MGTKEFHSLFSDVAVGDIVGEKASLLCYYCCIKGVFQPQRWLIVCPGNALTVLRYGTSNEFFRRDIVGKRYLLLDIRMG